MTTDEELRIIGLCGPKGSGKSILADRLSGYLIDNYSCGIASFAEPGKIIGMQLFGLNESSLYGTDEEKNQPTHLMFENLPGDHGRTGPMSGRDFMEHFMTNYVRRLYSDAFVHNMRDYIDGKHESRCYEQYLIIDDVRFPNEADFIHSRGGVVIQLKNRIDDTDLDSISIGDRAICEVRPDVIMSLVNSDYDERFLRVVSYLENFPWKPFSS